MQANMMLSNNKRIIMNVIKMHKINVLQKFKKILKILAEIKIEMFKKQSYF